MLENNSGRRDDLFLRSMVGGKTTPEMYQAQNQPPAVSGKVLVFVGIALICLLSMIGLYPIIFRP